MFIIILREYQTRVTWNIVAGDQPNTMDDAITNEPQRTTLGELKVKKKVPTNRADATRQGVVKDLNQFL